ncbi:MAG TPA: tetratricopeptide repeat protein [Rhabdochlamydiaceae bacterium]|jgi:tetratricopeptide (TPR) repeat protein
MALLEKYKEHFILFAEAGFVAINQGDEDAAIKLFKAAQTLDPKNSLAKVGMGYLHLCKLELKQAAKIFEEVLEDDPHNDMAKAFLGLSLSLNPKDVTRGEQVLTESAKNASDPMVKDLAKNALAFVEKFVKTPFSPATSQKPKK